MALIGIRELRENTSEVLRKVREEKEEFVITFQGRPVAMLLPIDEAAVEKAMTHAAKQSAASSLEEYLKLIEEFRRDFPAGVSTQAILDDIRKE